MIRRATMADIGQIVALGCSAYYASAYAKLFGAFDTLKAQTTLAQLIGDPRNYIVLVAVRGSAVVTGFIAAGVCELPFAQKRYVADLAFVSRGGRGVALMRRVRDWARERNLPCLFGNGGGNPLTDKLYTAIGLDPVGGIYAGE